MTVSLCGDENLHFHAYYYIHNLQKTSNLNVTSMNHLVSCNNPSLMSITFDAVETGEYLVRVDDFSGTNASITLSVECD